MSRDAVILSDKTKNESGQTQSTDTTDEVSENSMLVCSECDFSEIKDDVSWFEGDCCPNCQTVYLSKE